MFEKEKPRVFKAHNIHSDRAVAWLTWPGFMTLMMGLTWVLYREGMALGVMIPLLTLINFLVLLLLEYWLPARPEMGVFRDWQTFNDALHGIITGLVRPFGTALGLLVVAWLAQWRLDTPLKSLWPTDWPFLLQFVLAMLVHGFFSYWAHRLLHTVNVLWWFHAIHHDTNQMHVMKAGRFHFGDECFTAIITAAPLVVLGAPVDVIVMRNMWSVYNGAIEHTNTAQRFPSWFHYVVNNVYLHNLHHSMNRKYQDSNYSGVPIYDVLFGTFSHPDKCDVESFGIREQYVPTGLLAQLWFPFRALIRSPVHPSPVNPPTGLSP